MLRFDSIESLRAWAAWWVVLNHFLQGVGLGTVTSSNRLVAGIHKLALGGDTAVNIFIIVSGFVITHLLISKREAYLPYILRRWFRIFPIFLFCLGLALVTLPLHSAAWIAPAWSQATEMRLDRAASEHEFFVQHLLMHLTLLHGLVPMEVIPYAPTAFLGPAWSLSLEWQFYLLAPLILYFLARAPLVSTVLAAGFLVLNVALRLQHHFEWQYLSFLPLAMPHFLIGIGCRMAIEQRGAALTNQIVIALGSVLLADPLAVLVWTVFFLVALSEAKVIVLPEYAARIARLVALNRVTTSIGKWSYSTYLIHMPLISIIAGGGAVVVGDIGRPLFVALALLAVAMVLPDSWLLYEWIERPWIKIGSKVAGVWAKPATAAAAGSWASGDR